jgi:thermitase
VVGNLWFRDKIRLPEAHRITRGEGITVAVLDTGVDRSHYVLAPQLVGGFDFVDFDADASEVGAQGINAGYGHGTHVAGLVAAVAPEAKILPVRVLNENGVGNIWVLAEALEYAATVDPDGNPATDDKVRVINLSFATRRQTNLLSEIVSAVTCEDGDDTEDDFCFAEDRRGIAVIAAAGNSGAEIAEYPAAENVPGSLAVAATDQYDRRANFSTFGNWVQVAAPGVNIRSTVPGNQFASWCGTSMAAPLAAGKAALIRARFPDFKAADVTNFIVSKSDSVSGDVQKRINLYEAVK